MPSLAAGQSRSIACQSRRISVDWFYFALANLLLSRGLCPDGRMENVKCLDKGIAPCIEILEWGCVTEELSPDGVILVTNLELSAF
jgi:hypothetical protein